MHTGQKSVEKCIFPFLVFIVRSVLLRGYIHQPHYLPSKADSIHHVVYAGHPVSLVPRMKGTWRITAAPRSCLDSLASGNSWSVEWFEARGVCCLQSRNEKCRASSAMEAFLFASCAIQSFLSAEVARQPSFSRWLGAL